LLFSARKVEVSSLTVLLRRICSSFSLGLNMNSIIKIMKDISNRK
jgi:hypothetical protein